MTYNQKTEDMMAQLKLDGFNVWAMLGIFKRRSKLSPQIPDEVIQQVCLEYFKRKDKIKDGFPYFLTVLKRKSEDYFAKQNIIEGIKIKQQPMAIKDILRQLAQEEDK